MGESRLRRLADVPLWIAAMLSSSVILGLTLVRVFRPNPNTPWEAGMILDGWRIAHGLPIYDAGWTPNMYGPLGSYSIGGAFALLGAHNQIPRLISLSLGMATVVVLTRVFRARSLVLTAAIFALLLGVNSRTGIYFADARPDAAALFFSTISLLCFFQGYSRNSWRTIALGIGALLLAFFFKQPSAAIALIPPVAIAITRRRARTSTFLPLCAVLLAILGLRIMVPSVYHSMIEVPQQYRMIPHRLLTAPLDFLATLPMLWLAVIVWIGEKKNEVGTWAFVALLVTFLLGIPAAAKMGGSRNSMMPAYAAAACFCAYNARTLDAWLRGTSGRRALAMNTAVGAVLLISVLAEPNFIIGPVGEGQGDNAYPLAVATAAALPGPVVAPDDPTIVMYARGLAGVQAHVAADAHRWSFPSAVDQELKSANYVIQLRHTFGRTWVTDDVLNARGFGPVATALDGTAYRVWRRFVSPPASGSAGTGGKR